MKHHSGQAEIFGSSGFAKSIKKYLLTEFAQPCFQRLQNPDFGAGHPTGINNDAIFICIQRDWERYSRNEFHALFRSAG